MDAIGSCHQNRGERIHHRNADPMNTEKLAEIDDHRITQFEQDWMKGQPKDVAEYLPSPTDSRYVGTLQEMVHIDMEFRWKEFQKSEQPGHQPPNIEQYLERFPELETVKLSLIQGEFELATRYGDHPSVQQFVERFGDTVGDSALTPVLQSLLSEIQLNRVVKPGTTIGRYEINGEHGRGGFGAVWRKRTPSLGVVLPSSSSVNDWRRTRNPDVDSSAKHESPPSSNTLALSPSTTSAPRKTTTLITRCG